MRGTVVCPICNSEVPPHVRLCQVCSTDNGYPNVRIASDPEEVAALDARYQGVLQDARARGYIEQIIEFENMVRARSKAVISRSYRQSLRTMLAEEPVLLTYYLDVDLQMRNPEDNEWDLGRESVDTTLFPGYHKNVHFAVLSPASSGSGYYGAVSMVLRDEIIRNRASVFEMNSRRWIDMSGLASQALPLGYRAEWGNRHILAVAKVGAEIGRHDKITEDQYCSLLLSSSDAAESDFIEVHIYQPLHLGAVELVLLRMPDSANEMESLVAPTFKAVLDQLKIEYEVVS